MKRIRTADGGLMLFEDEDYMPKLLVYLQETAGYDAAALVEQWAQKQKELHLDAVVKAENDAFEARNRAARMFKEMRDERDEHIKEIEELEGELTALAGFKDKLLDTNEYLLDLVNNPEKLFPAIGTEVWRMKNGAAERGSIDTYKLRMNGRAPEFFVRINWIVKKMGGHIAKPRWSKFSNIGKTIHICAGDGPNC